MSKKNMANEIAAKKKQIEKELKNLEDHIYERETEYLADTHSTGNLVKGWEYLLDSKRQITKDMLMNFKVADFAKDYDNISYNSSYKNFKAPDSYSRKGNGGKVRNEDRVFSKSSKTAPIEEDYSEYHFPAPPIKIESESKSTAKLSTRRRTKK